MQTPPLVPPNPQTDLGGDLNPVTVLCGDCRKVIPTLLPDGLVNMVLTDPPYGMDYRTNRTDVKGPAVPGDRDLTYAWRVLSTVVCAAYQKLTSDAWYYLFCNNALRDLLTADRKLSDELMEGELQPGYDELIWAKPVGSGDVTGQRYRPSYERVLVFRKGQPKLNGHPGNLIWGDRPGRKSKIHSMQKELYGLVDMIEQATRPGEVILDPFAGSGSVAAAMCMFLPESEWRRIILIEQDEAMCERIARRLSPFTKVGTEL